MYRIFKLYCILPYEYCVTLTNIVQIYFKHFNQALKSSSIIDINQTLVMLFSIHIQYDVNYIFGTVLIR